MYVMRFANNTGYVRNVLEDAQDYREHAALYKPPSASASASSLSADFKDGPPTLTVEDVTLAMQSRLNASFAPPSREVRFGWE
jgi:hypothetical protein